MILQLGGDATDVPGEELENLAQTVTDASCVMIEPRFLVSLLNRVIAAEDIVLMYQEIEDFTLGS